MLSIPRYRLSEEIDDESRTIVDRSVRETESLSFSLIIKVLKNSNPSFSELVQFCNQYIITKKLNYLGMIPSYSLESYKNGYALVMEDFGIVYLKEYFAKNNNVVSLQKILQMAIALGDALKILYRDRIIYKDIKFSNILINPEIKQVKLIDFSIAFSFLRATQTIVSSNE